MLMTYELTYFILNGREHKWQHMVIYIWQNIGSGNGLAPIWCQAITWTNVDLLSIGLWGTNSVKLNPKYNHFHSRNCIWICQSTKQLPFWSGLNSYAYQLTYQCLPSKTTSSEAALACWNSYKTISLKVLKAGNIQGNVCLLLFRF